MPPPPQKPVQAIQPRPVPQQRPNPAIQANPTPAPLATAPPARSEDDRRRVLFFLFPLVPVGILAMSLFVVVVRDFFVKAEVLEQPASAAAQPELLDEILRIELKYHDLDIPVTVGKNGMKPPTGKALEGERAAWEPSMRFGMVMSNGGKRLTFKENGMTNNACVQLDSREFLYGESKMRMPDGSRREMASGIYHGRWKDQLSRSMTLGNTDKGRVREGRKSIWYCDDEKVQITQTVEIVPGPQSRVLDTCLIRYTIENQDSQPHDVGIRFLLDTFIGANDGVPYTIPGRDQLCDTQLEFNKAEEIPDFIQALENQDLRNPGTVAQIHIRFGSGLEAPSRVTLGAWPNAELATRDNRCREMMTMWEVPVLPMRSIAQVDASAMGDSAVALYWPKQQVAAGGKREVGFAYGVGQLGSDSGAGGRLALSVGGSFVVNGQFTVTALVSKPVAGETISLELPPGLQLIKGDPTQPVPPAATSDGNSPVTWRVKATRAGSFAIKVKLSTGLSQSQTINIRSGGGIFN